VRWGVTGGWSWGFFFVLSFFLPAGARAASSRAPSRQATSWRAASRPGCPAGMSSRDVQPGCPAGMSSRDVQPGCPAGMSSEGTSEGTSEDWVPSAFAFMAVRPPRATALLSIIVQAVQRSCTHTKHGPDRRACAISISSDPEPARTRLFPHARWQIRTAVCRTFRVTCLW
jgi:hypothetical protein